MTKPKLELVQVKQESKMFDFDGMKIETIVIEQDGKEIPLMNAREVATLLMYTKPQNAIKQHCKNALQMSKLDIEKLLLSGCPKTGQSSKDGASETIYSKMIAEGHNHNDLVRKHNWISEFDIYRLIFGSKMPKAEQFQDWVCEVVLPSLRQHGGYVVGQEDETDPAMIMAKALQVADSVIKQKEAELEVAKQETEEIKETCRNVTEQWINDGQTAPQFCKKLNGVNTPQVQKYLSEKGILINRKTGWSPASYSRDKYFTEKTSDHFGVTTHQSILTQKGAIWLYKKYLKGELPMKKDWNGKFTNEVFEGMSAKQVA